MRVAPRRSISDCASANARDSRQQKGHHPPRKKLTTTGPRSRPSDRLTKLPVLPRSLNSGALSPALTACLTKCVCANLATEFSKATTTPGGALTSKACRQASSFAFKDIGHQLKASAQPGSITHDYPWQQSRRGNIVHSLREWAMDRLAAMEAFVRVVDAGSFSGAAKQLRVGQPAVSKTIAQLEDRLGVRLLLRSTHGLTPTEAGRNFYNRAKRSIEEAEEAELAARGAAATLSGRLRFCAPLTFARLHVMPSLPAFLTEHPLLDIDAYLDDRDIDLVAAGIDVALLIGRLADSTATAR